MGFLHLYTAHPPIILRIRPSQIPSGSQAVVALGFGRRYCISESNALQLHKELDVLSQGFIDLFAFSSTRWHALWYIVVTRWWHKCTGYIYIQWEHTICNFFWPNFVLVSMVLKSLHRSRFVWQSQFCRHPQLLSFRPLQDSADAAAWELDKLPCLLEKLLSQWAPCGLMGYVEGRERERVIFWSWRTRRVPKWMFWI